jgi:formate C-acetyltransferase
MILPDLTYWKGRTVQDALRPLWQEQWGDLIEDGIKTRMAFAFDTPVPHGRQVVDFPRVLNQGLSGIIEETKDRLNDHLVLSYEDLHKKYFLEAVIISCNAVITLAKRYATLLKEAALKEEEPARRIELKEMAQNLEQVPAHPARTFHQAVQSIWFIHLAVEIENNSWGYSSGSSTLQLR